MSVLILGLVIFLGIHSVRIVADDWRTAQRERIGATTWKLGYSLVSAIGLGLVIWGFGLARHVPVVIWTPPIGTRHIASLLTLIAFILIAATYVPRNSIKASVHHPMALGVAAWATGHLLANGSLADIVLFASFLVWAIFSFKASRQRDQTAHHRYPAGTVKGTAMTVVAGLVAWIIFALWLHGPLIGVRPFS